MSQALKLNGASNFDVFDRNYEELVDSFYVGETAYVRLVDPTANLTSEKDRITIQVTTPVDKAPKSRPSRPSP